MSEQLDMNVVEGVGAPNGRLRGECELPLMSLRRDGGTQLRIGLDEETISRYSEQMESGQPFPPVDVKDDGENYWLADGFHRWEAERRRGSEHIRAFVEPGSRKDAVKAAARGNSRHGIPLTREDRNKAIRQMHGDGFGPSEIAADLGISEVTIYRVIKPKQSTDKKEVTLLLPGNGSVPYPFEQKRDWNEEQKDQAREVLERLPEPERPLAAKMVSEPGTPVDLSLKMLDKLADAPPDVRNEKLTEYQSEDSRKKVNAVTWAADRAPEPDPQLADLRECLRTLTRCARRYPDDPHTPLLRDAAQLIQQAIDSIKGGKERVTA